MKINIAVYHRMLCDLLSNVERDETTTAQSDPAENLVSWCKSNVIFLWHALGHEGQLIVPLLENKSHSHAARLEKLKTNKLRELLLKDCGVFSRVAASLICIFLFRRASPLISYDTSPSSPISQSNWPSSSCAALLTSLQREKPSWKR